MIKRAALTPWLALSGGALFPLALAPFYWWPVGLLSLGLLYLTLQSANSTRRAFLISWCYAFGQFGAGVSWIYVSVHDHGGTPAFLAVPLVGVFAAFLALIPASWFALRQRLCGQHLSVITFASFWLLQEWCRSWFLTGFPWLFAGDAHLNTWLSGWAPVSGAYSISVILALTAAGIIAFMQTRRWVALLPLLLWPAGEALRATDWTDRTGEITVGIVQGNVEQERKWLTEEIFPTMERYQSDSEALFGTDLILWPETAITMLYQRYEPYMNRFARQARAAGSTIVTGIPFRWPQGTELAGEYHNSIVAFGDGEGLYHKQRLVPFGEYIPLERAIRGLIPFFDLPMSSFLSGDSEQAPLRVNLHGEEQRSARIMPYICYEIAYPDLVLRGAKEAGLLVTISNDAWFGDSLGPKQHMALAQMRALETGRWVLRSTNTGISALVDHRGRIVERAPVAIRTHFTGTAELRSGNTLYMQLGVIPLLCLMTAPLILAGYRQRKGTA